MDNPQLNSEGFMPRLVSMPATLAFPILGLVPGGSSPMLDLSKKENRYKRTRIAVMVGNGSG